MSLFSCDNYPSFSVIANKEWEHFMHHLVYHEKVRVFFTFVLLSKTTAGEETSKTTV